MNAESRRARYGRVAVVMGGTSSERQVSLWSGEASLAALLRQGIDAEAVDGIPALIEALLAKRFERVFVILHGPGGEDGVLQGALEALGVPYTGSGVLGSAIGMDKIVTKRLWQSIGIPTAAFLEVPADWDANALREAFGLPLVLKPAREGSTFGVSLCHTPEQLAAGLAEARRYRGPILAERLIEGREYTIGILGEQALPVIAVVPAQGFYDFDAKYLSEATQYLIPSGLDPARETELQELALRAFRAIGASGWGRVDLIVDRAGEAFFLEVNTNPGMTSHSLVPKAAAAIGIDFDQLCLRILETSMEPRR